jgi:cellulose synthase (UDP-forming)
MINTFCHLQAVVDALRDKVQAWVPTGATNAAPAKKKGNVPLRTAVIGRVWFFTTQGLLWAGIARAIIDGVNPLLMWPTILLAGIQVWMLGPVLVSLKPAVSRAHRADARDRANELAHASRPQVSWPLPASSHSRSMFPGLAAVAHEPRQMTANS